MKEPIRLCKDCKWAKINYENPDLSKCTNPKALGEERFADPDPIVGERKSMGLPRTVFCELQRKWDGEHCGIEAQYFEPIEILPEEMIVDRFTNFWKDAVAFVLHLLGR